jgi:threonyl-tRNA synthetase
MPNLTLPDGTIKEFDQPVSFSDVAKSIGPGLFKAAVAGKIEEQIFDLSHLINNDSNVSIITKESDEGLEIIRHSTAHLMAHAVKELYPEAEVTIGPVIENGFFYDFAIENPFTDEDLGKIEMKMHEIAKQDFPISREVWQKKDAVGHFKNINENYKAEIIEDIPDDEDLSIYKQGDWMDLCRGPHVPSTNILNAFKLTKVAGAYWRGDSSNEMLQRIYGTAWADKKSLSNYLEQLKQAEKRDHRRIGKDLDLFSIQEEAGGGLVFWHPNGSKIRQVIEDYWRTKHLEAGYELLYTPHIALDTLWQTSGHTDFYQESMYTPIEDENRLYRLKPMNCPFHILIYKNQLRSYRDLPIRWAELGTVYRHEMTGALHGLMRVRGFTQDDAHIFCTEDQVETEITNILNLTIEILQAFTFDQYEIHLATKPEKSVGNDRMWTKATQALEQALSSKDLDYVMDEEGGAFYGPKIDIKIKDAIGRLWQCSTIQLDFNLPERFDMQYIGSDGKKHNPVMIHRTLLGSMERFFGVLIEHFEGKFPLWLAPTQITILTISDSQNNYAEKIYEKLKKMGFRVKIDLRNEKIGSKIRDHTLKRVPYFIILGNQEVELNQISVRARKGDDLGKMELDQFVKNLKKELTSKK